MSVVAGVRVGVLGRLRRDITAAKCWVAAVQVAILVANALISAFVLDCREPDWGCGEYGRQG